MRSRDFERGLRPLIGGLTLPLLLFVLVGCGSATGTVSGTVKFKGQPVPHAWVSFNPPEFKGVQNATTDENGRYTVSDLPVGTVKIIVLTQKTILPPPADKREGKKKGTEGLKTPEELGKTARKYVAIPFKYSTIENSGLTYEVQPGSQEHDIELK